MALQMVLEDQLESFLMSDPSAIGDPYPLYDELRGVAANYWHERGPAHFVTRYQDVLSSLQNAGPVSQGGYARGTRARAIEARLPEADRRLFHEVLEFESLYVSRSDGDRHARLRRLAHRAFTPRRIALLEESVARFVDELVGAWSGGTTVDVMSELAMRLPTMVICDLLAVPAEDRPKVRRWADTISRNRGGADVDALRAGHAAIQEFRTYVGELVEIKRRHGDGTELVLALIDAAEDGERLSNEELVAMFVVLLFAGSETTTNLIASGLRSLLIHREQWDRLCAEPDLVRSGVDELLRYESPVQFLLKVAAEDLEIAGRPVAEGDTVILSLAGANRDPEQFPDPHRLDVGRKPNRHVALGFGPHFCLGASLARLEGQAVFSALTRRFPDMQLAVDPSELVWQGNAMLRGLRELPVDLGPAAA
jgi:cytochrome P450